LKADLKQYRLIEEKEKSIKTAMDMTQLHVHDAGLSVNEEKVYFIKELSKFFFSFNNNVWRILHSSTQL
jgi:hypothetical protein